MSMQQEAVWICKGLPPDAFMKRLEALDSSFKPPVTIYRSEPRMQKLMKGLSSTDLEIVRRLEKLREDKRVQDIPSEDDIARRLALLKGQDIDQPSNKPARLQIHALGEQMTQDLVTQCREEVNLDDKSSTPIDDIAERLNRLKNRGTGSQEPSIPGQSVKENNHAITLDEIAQLLAQCKMEAAESGKQPDLATIVSLEKLRTRLLQQNEKMEHDPSSDEDDDKAVAKILSRVQAEVDLDRSLGLNDDPEDVDIDMGEGNNQEELPWCIICNEDAKIRCLGCDRDLYCKSCFQEGHADEDMRSHSIEPFKKK
ncbi:Abscission/NoCut checkpoint regulator [Frankliniella fusca]|uniref:Abscission/NoCut checkpoint regulator n=1 Tax=Frankliniella fusca TaxID=407009 RepID=A0AAE1HJ15_9NEOP|nr:Abscission/NoCut checkpoint regulator [Frankliniella fusca]